MLLGRFSLFAAFLCPDCRLSMPDTPVCIVLVVTMTPQQLPESSIWPHIGYNSSCGISSVVSYASSMELGFGFPRSRWAAVSKSPSNVVYVVQLSSFLEVTQKRSRDSSPLRGRVAHLSRGTRVRALSMFRRPSEHRPDHQKLQAEGVLVDVPEIAVLVITPPGSKLYLRNQIS